MKTIEFPILQEILINSAWKKWTRGQKIQMICPLRSRRQRMIIPYLFRANSIYIILIIQCYPNNKCWILLAFECFKLFFLSQNIILFIGYSIPLSLYYFFTGFLCIQFNWLVVFTVINIFKNALFLQHSFHDSFHNFSTVNLSTFFPIY